MKNISASVRDRLYKKAKEESKPFNEVLQYYAIERLLYRLSRSKYADDFVLKGALLFFGWGIGLRRATKDIDLIRYTAVGVESLEEIFKEIFLVSVEPDGLEFDPSSVSGRVILRGTMNEGVRLKFQAKISKAKVYMQVDVGFSEKIIPGTIMVDYPVLLDMQAPRLRSYPPEVLIAEKLEAIISLGMVNSRMKDFYDIYIVSQEFDLDGQDLVDAISETFKTRNTEIPESIPDSFKRDFIEEKTSQWQAFIRRMPNSDFLLLEDVVKELKKFLLQPMSAAQASKPFVKEWRKSDNWR